MNELLTILDSALAANLSKRQWAAFTAILRQTLGFRKTHDDISAGRLQQLTGIQRNHIWKAKKELVTLGIITSQSGHYGEILSFPCLQKPSSQSSKPPPDSGNTPPKTEPSTPNSGNQTDPKQAKTLSNQTVSNHNNKPPPDIAKTQGLRWPAGLDPTAKNTATAWLCGLSMQQAQTVLDILAMGLQNNSVRKPLAYLRALIQKAHNGELDTTDLETWRRQQQPASNTNTPTNTVSQQQREHHAEWQWVQQMAALQNLPVEVVAQQLSVPIPSMPQSQGGNHHVPC